MAATDKPEMTTDGEVGHDETPMTRILFLVEGLINRIDDAINAMPYEDQNEKRLLRLMVALRCVAEIKDDRGRECKLSPETYEGYQRLFDKVDNFKPGFIAKPQEPDPIP